MHRGFVDLIIVHVRRELYTHNNMILVQYWTCMHSQSDYIHQQILHLSISHRPVAHAIFDTGTCCGAVGGTRAEVEALL
jgi:hypothetical protein